MRQADLAAALGDRYDHSVISKVERNLSALLSDGLTKAAQVLDISTDYLLGLTDDPTPAADRDSGTEAPSREKVLPFIPAGKSASLDDEFESVRRYDRSSLRLAAGSHSFSDIESAAGEVRFRRDWLRAHHLKAASLVLLDATGDSMAPAIRDGDSVLVDESRTKPVDGRVFAVRTVDGPLVKRLRRRSGRWWADSDNREHESRSISREDRLLGMVVWWAHTE